MANDSSASSDSDPQPDSDERSADANSSDPAANGDASALPEDVDSAGQHVELLRRQLEQAESYYDELREKAADKVEQLRDQSIGETIDGALEFVKRHPGVSVAGAAVLGFLVGRLFRR